MAEYGSMFAISAIATVLFLGGWHIGLVPYELSETFLGPIVGNIINVVVFIAKGWLLVFVMMWVRWTLPRLRIDQVMMTCLKYLLPIACVLLIGVSIWQLVVPPPVRDIVQKVIAAVSLALLVFFLVRVVSAAPPKGMIPPSMDRWTPHPAETQA